MHFLSFFSMILWLHLTVTPSTGLEKKPRLNVSNALLCNSFSKYLPAIEILKCFEFRKGI